MLAKLANVLGNKGWKTNAEVAATEAKWRADWAKAHPGIPYPEIRLGMVSPFGGVGGAAGPVNSPTRWVKQMISSRLRLPRQKRGEPSQFERKCPKACS
jgi:hypothetical protein